MKQLWVTVLVSNIILVLYGLHRLISRFGLQQIHACCDKPGLNPAVNINACPIVNTIGSSTIRLKADIYIQ